MICAKKHIVYPPFRKFYFIFHILALLITVLWLGLIYGLVFGVGLGLSGFTVFLILSLSLIGSNINLPLFYIRSWRPILKAKVVRFFFMDFVIPTVDWEEQKTLVAVNLGGCVIPLTLSIYLIIKMIISSGLSVLLPLFAALTLNSLLIYSVAKPVEGLGIVTPALLPPILTLIVCEIVLSLHPLPINVFAFIYSIGTLGALIGADLLNLGKIPRLGAPVVSIGGAGIFDGIFLNGLIAVIFALL